MMYSDDPLFSVSSAKLVLNDLVQKNNSIEKKPKDEERPWKGRSSNSPPTKKIGGASLLLPVNLYVVRLAHT